MSTLSDPGISDLPSHLRVSEEFDPRIPKILPHDKVYSIQVGYKLFRLSGASLSSDAPSYFTKFFSQPDHEEQVLFIDRNPNIFEKIYSHLQGYHIEVSTSCEFVHLWSDSYYFGLKRLQDQLSNEDIFATIGDQSFKIPKILLMNAGNHPNFFSVSYDTLLTDNLKVIETRQMLRPPPQRPATVVNRSPKLFNDLLELLRGNTTVIQNEHHRNLLIKECKYYRFLELEQKIVAHKLQISPLTGKPEIIINLMNLSPKGVAKVDQYETKERPLLYSRPFIKEPTRPLIFQINNDSTVNPYPKLIINKTDRVCVLQVQGDIRAKIISVFRSISNDLREDQSFQTTSILTGIKGSKATINGLEMKPDWWSTFFEYSPLQPSASDADTGPSVYNTTQSGSSSNIDDSPEEPYPKRLKIEPDPSGERMKKPDIIQLVLKRSLWRMYHCGHNLRLHAVSIDGITDYAAYTRENVDFL